MEQGQATMGRGRLSIEFKPNDWFEDQQLSHEVQEKHSPDGRKVDVHPLLKLVEGIFENKVGKQDGKAISPDLLMMIERVSCEMVCKCLSGTDDDGATFSVLGILSPYSWEAKLVITLAAFAANYGEFLLLSQVYSTDPLVQSMALLKKIPLIPQQGGDDMKRQMAAIKALITTMLKVTKMLVVDFSDKLRSDATVKHVHIQFPLVVYWTIMSAAAAAKQMASIDLFSPSTLPKFKDKNTGIEIELSTNLRNLEEILKFLEDKKENLLGPPIIYDKEKEEADNNAKGRAILAEGSVLAVTVQGTTIDDVQSKFSEWKKRVDELGGAFYIALQEKEGPEHKCCRFEFSTAAGKNPHEMKCPECDNQMENYITFMCCHDKGVKKH